MQDSATALQALQSFQMPDENSVLNSAQQKYGVQDAQNRVNTYKTLTNNLTGAIAAVDPSVTGRTSGSLVTEGQRGALVNRERAPIIGQLGTANQGLSDANNTLNVNQNNAKSEAANTISAAQTKYNMLKDNYSLANSREQAAKDAADKAAAFEYQKQQDSIHNNQAQQKISASGDGGSQVDPAKDFLDYIGSQFKAAGGAGNKAVSRQQQDAWANAFFQKNGVSNANRQAYWDLYNKTYNRTADPTKDWRYKR